MVSLPCSRTNNFVPSSLKAILLGVPDDELNVDPESTVIGSGLEALAPSLTDIEPSSSTVAEPSELEVDGLTRILI